MGTTCSIGNKTTNYCGVDLSGYTYYHTQDKYSELTCQIQGNGTWTIKSDPAEYLTEPVCKSVPCPLNVLKKGQLIIGPNVTDTTVTNDIQCFNEEVETTLIEDNILEGC